MTGAAPERKIVYKSPMTKGQWSNQKVGFGYLLPNRMRWLVIYVLIASVASGCASWFPSTGAPGRLAASEGVTATVTADPAIANEISPGVPPEDQSRVQIPDEIPPVDLSIHSVPLEEIFFDTFRPVNRAVPLSSAHPDLIRQLQDAIPPIHDPVYEPGQSAEWLAPEDRVLGYATIEGAWAFPVRILNYHEIVNDVLAGEPVLVSYCPLCYSGVVYSRQLGVRELTFGNTSALFESDMVMLDYQTGSYWWQVAGKAIVGPLTDQTLVVLPSQTTTWQTWLDLHPETLVLSRETGFYRDYSRDPFLDIAESINEGRFAFPVSDAVRDERLQAGELVVSVLFGSTSRAYPLMTSFSRVIHDVIESNPIVVLI